MRPVPILLVEACGGLPLPNVRRHVFVIGFFVLGSRALGFCLKRVMRTGMRAVSLSVDVRAASRANRAFGLTNGCTLANGFGVLSTAVVRLLGAGRLKWRSWSLELG